MSRWPDLERLRGGLIVSCQAADGDPLRNPLIVAALAEAATLGGASGIRANGVDVRAIRQVVDAPILGLQKRLFGGTQCITPLFSDAQTLVRAGASLLAIEATQQRKEMAATHLVESFEPLVERIHRDLRVPVLADISTLEEGIEAERLGADLVATTLSGYTPQSPARSDPDFDLLRALVQRVRVPVVVEGHLWVPEQAAEALALGAFAAVVGSAITRPRAITERFVAALRRA